MALRLLLALALGCHRRAEVVDNCVEDACPPCESDEDCVYQGNACTDTVYCAHEDSGVAVVQIGCSEALTRRWPKDDTCVCREEVCRSLQGSP